METKVDWIIHYVSTNVTCDMCGGKEEDMDFVVYNGFPCFANIHTHGLANHGQREICIPLDITPDKAMPLLNSMGIQVAEGKTIYTEGIRSDVLAGDYDVQFITFDDDDTLYMLLPDTDNHLPDMEGCQFPYSLQRRYAEIIHNEKMEDKSGKENP